MDELGVDVSVVFTYDGLLRPTPEANDSLARFVAAAPERMVAFATVDPRDPGAGAEVERCVREHGMRGVKLHPWLQGFSAHEPGLQDLCEAAAELGLPILFHDGTPPFSTPLQLATLARRHPRTTVILGHGGLHDLWREAIAAVATTDNVHLCMCATPGYAMRAIVARCPLERLLFGTDAGLRPDARSALRQAAHPPARRARPRCSRARGDSRGQPETVARRMIDVHTHVPTHRDRVPEDELSSTRPGAPTGAVTATTTWADYEEAFADIELSIAFTIARDRDAGRRRPQRRCRRVRRGSARPPDRLPLDPSRGRRGRGRARAGAHWTSGYGGSSSARTTRSSIRSVPRRCASTSWPSVTACPSSSTREPRRCGTPRCGSRTRSSWMRWRSASRSFAS